MRIRNFENQESFPNSSVQCISRHLVHGALAVMFLAGMACAPRASAQSSSGTPASQDPNAVSAVNMAITSMGGSTAFNSIQDATVTGQVSATNATPSAPATQIMWQTIGMSIRCSTTSQSGTSLYTVQNSAGYVEDSSGNVSPMDSRLALTLYPFHLPGAVLNFLLNAPNESLSVIQDAGASANIVHVRFLQQMSDPTLTPLTQQDWYIDTNLGLPNRVDYYLPNVTNPAQDGTATILFTSWQKSPTILMPQVMNTLQNGTSTSSITVGAPQFNQGLTASIFTLP